MPIYLDYAATTPVDPVVAAAMTRYLGPDGVFGNPASRSHAFGKEAEAAVDHARTQVAELVNAEPREIVWTSGATESDNLAIKGVVECRPGEASHIVTSDIEHRAVLDTCRHLEARGVAVTRIMPDSRGVISPESVESAIRTDTVLVSLMHVNNELGTVTDIEAIGRITQARGVLFHVDAAQSAARIPLDLTKVGADLVSLSGHKMYGPKGIGALYVRRASGVRPSAQIHGGGHERGLRSGTLPTHQIVGMGEAAHLLLNHQEPDRARAAALEARFLEGLGSMDGVFLNGAGASRVPGILNLRFASAQSESLLLALPELCVSTGSACSAARVEPSHVLLSLGLEEDQAHECLRFSIGRFTTAEEIDHASRRVRSAVAELRALSTGWPSAWRVSEASAIVHEHSAPR